MRVFLHLFIYSFIMFNCHLLEVQFFLMCDRKGVDVEGRRGGKELGRLDGGKSGYTVSEKTIFCE